MFRISTELLLYEHLLYIGSTVRMIYYVHVPLAKQHIAFITSM